MTGRTRDNDPPGAQLAALVTLFEQGRFTETLIKADALIRVYPNSFALWNIVGLASVQLTQNNQAISAFSRACAINPADIQVHINLGNLLLGQGRLDEAERVYRHVLMLKPDFADAHGNLGVVLKAQGRLEAAAASYRRALALRPAYFQAHGNLANVLREQGKLNEAAAACRRAIAIKPDYADAHNNLGNVLREQGKLDEAIASWRQALMLRPAFFQAHNNLGGALKEKGRFGEAIACYTRALELVPDFAEAHYNLGSVFHEQGQLDMAVAAYRRALAYRPDYADAFNNLGNVLNEQGKLDEAVDSYRRALALEPGFTEVEAQLLRLQQDFCDWRTFDNLDDACARLSKQDAAPAPFNILPLVDDAALQLQFSRKWACKHFSSPPQAVGVKPGRRAKRLRVGYFSADFHDHATLFLMAGLLREHDTSRFEIFAYSYGKNPAGSWGEQARNTVEHFFDVTRKSSQDIAELARSHALDIAIDLKGYTADSRLDLFQYRPAPVQISYLGYPGSLSADFIDYIVADHVVIPDDQRVHYSERVIWLPCSYQPNDNKRTIADTTTTRADFGLPEQGFVFCCFNGSYKITPREFDIWMRVLGAVDGSVLWLYRSNRWCEHNLRKEAVGRGIAPERLVFAERADHARHLARHKHADLFLDTFNVNAHTTASDALWAGLPVVTKAGRQFAARVSASLLTAVGLPDLITHSEREYEALIIALANDPTKLNAIRARLAADRLKHPLYDTHRYTRHFETALNTVYDAYVAGNAPRDVGVALLQA